MKPTTHNTEQAARGFVIYELARRGYLVQATDSRFPVEDLLVVSPKGKHFGIDVKGQRTKNFWQIKEPLISDQLFYCLVYLSKEGLPEVFILESKELNKLWNEYRDRILGDGGREDGRWGILWTTPFPYKGKWDILPE